MAVNYQGKKFYNIGPRPRDVTAITDSISAEATIRTSKTNKADRPGTYSQHFNF